jgi:hypothetical protein
MLMELERKIAEAKIDGALHHVASKMDAIIAAELDLGLSVEDGICSAVRQYFSTRRSPAAQLKLNLKGKGNGS